jgi:hypothetical protein
VTHGKPVNDCRKQNNPASNHTINIPESNVTIPLLTQLSYDEGGDKWIAIVLVVHGT